MSRKPKRPVVAPSVNMKLEKKRVLAVGAHPDDVEFIYGGTLALLHGAGFEIDIATVCSGDKGSAELGPKQIARIRFKEAIESAKVLNATYTSLAESDLELTFNNKLRAKVVELVRRTDPFVVITNSPDDYMRDHETTADLLWDACFGASVMNYETNQPNPAKPTDAIPFLFYGDAFMGLNRFGAIIPIHFYVDISSVMETKEEMLSKHESQRTWLKKQHGIDEYIESMRNWCRIKGEDVGVQFAEAFRQHKGHPFPHENILQKILPNQIKVRKGK